MKKYYFMSGLPRCGSTLLKSILNQNPDIHTNPVSPVMELMYYTEQYFKASEQYLAYPKPKNAHKIIKSYIENYYYDREENIIIDHCRSWPNNIERIKNYITPNPKIICPVRNVNEILTSFIVMIRRNSDQISFVDRHLIENNIELNDDNRCDHLMSDYGIVGQALWSQSQAFIKNDTKYLLMIEYDDLLSSSDETMKKIYDFLEIDYYSHNFDHIENNCREDESQWYLKDMHHIRKKLEKKSPKPEDILSSYILNKYNNLEYWKYPNSPYLKNDFNK
jgi:sulfotransferase